MLRQAFGRLQVHQQAGAGVDLDHGAALALQRLRDVERDHVDAGNVQADGARRQTDGMGHLGVDLGRAVDRDIAVALYQHPAPGFRNAVGLQVLAFQVLAHDRVFVDVDAVQRKVFGQATARVGVDLAVDQLQHAVLAVADDPGRFATRCRDDLATHHQQAVFVTRNRALNQHFRAFGVGQREGGREMLLTAQVQRHATAVVAIRGLDHHRQADVLRRFPGFLGRTHGPAFGHRHAAGAQQGLGQVLVAGNAGSNGVGAVGLRGPDAALACPMAQLHQVAVVQPDMRNAPVGGGGDDGGGRRAEVAVVDGVAHALYGGGHVKRLVAQRGHQQRMAFAQCAACHLLVAGAEHHAVDAGLGGAAGLAKAGRHAGQVQQLDHHMLQHMAAPGALIQALQEATRLADTALVFTQRRQALGQALAETGQTVAGVILQHTQVQPDFEDGAVGPHIGTAQVIDAKQLNVVEVVH